MTITPLLDSAPKILVAMFLTSAPLLPLQAADRFLPIASAFPPPGASEVCPDAPLRLTFDQAAQLGTTGRIEVRDAADRSLADAIDIAAPIDTQTIGGLDNYRFHRVLLAGRQASIILRNGALRYGHTYYVTVTPSAFADTDGIENPTAWRFTTKAAAPAANAPRLVVAANGSGDFCTVQAALDFLPAGNIRPVTIFIRRGTYNEIVSFTEKHSITILGEDRKETVIAYANNDRFNNASNGNPFGGTSPSPVASSPRTGAIYRRGMFLAHRVNDFTVANLTLRNTTPQGGSQAEAIILNGTTTARAILKDVDLFSFQDTLQINGQAYLYNCYLEGDVDFMWGTGPCFFENCTARSLRNNAYYTQIRNPPANHGYVFLACAFQGAPGITGNFLSRIQPSRFPASEVVLLDCRLTEAVSPVGWQLQSGTNGIGDISLLHFWEAGSRDAAGQAIDASKRMTGSRQLSGAADASLIADYRNPAFVLGNGWNPREAAVFR